jgi:dynein heavy chain
MQICVSEQMNSETPLNVAEWNFFLKGGEVMDRASQLQKPEGVTWINDQAWDNITELDKLSETFKGIAQAVGVGKDWLRWYQYDNPEERGLPGEW